ncbi:Metal-dependent hydrolase, beta-lactamase superfamily II [Agrococcus baldri]|uniref:Metal-dependent hydrolase, beta-lactamase superfamily II n=1 Tax=Agrococcus baldri TaxID=153730 RepID=A0AA94HKD3_9MICO|nr:Metal-dependent hydrolase, beta-lactamase superfamily II [Agrococcus baldri]
MTLTGTLPRQAAQSTPRFLPVPERRYFAIVESLSHDERVVRLDLIDATDERFSGAEFKRTSGIFRRMWQQAFESQPSVSQISTELSTFKGGLLETDVSDLPTWSSVWPEASNWAEVVFGSSFEIREVRPVPIGDSRRLDRIFGMAAWPSATADRVATVLGATPRLAAFATFDVGQGAASALVDAQGFAFIYSDVGAAFGGNARTRPTNLKYCVCEQPVVVLSHWHQDHWAGVDFEPRLLRSQWIAPRQAIGKTQSQFGAAILEAGGDILIVKRSSKPRVSIGQRTQEILIDYCRGNSINDSGIVLTVRRLADKLLWIFPGDADYSMFCPQPGRLVGLVATHHGAKPRQPGAVPSPGANAYHRLVYSFGVGNIYGHPHPVALNAHLGASWSSAKVRQTSGRPGTPARGPVAVGWTQPPRQLFHLPHCLEVPIVS